MTQGTASLLTVLNLESAKSLAPLHMTIHIASLPYTPSFILICTLALTDFP